jgi:hypothetical protein
VRYERLGLFLPEQLAAEVRSEGEPSTSRGVHPRNRLNELTGDQWLYLTRSVWPTSFPFVYGHHLRRAHGANKPPQLMAQLVEFFTKTTGRVLDPFAGVGGTLIGASIAAPGPRAAVGIEISADWARVYERVLDEHPDLKRQPMIVGDCREVMDRWLGGVDSAAIDGTSVAASETDPFDFIAADPPYNIHLPQTMSGKGGAAYAEGHANRRSNYNMRSEEEGDLANLGDFGDPQVGSLKLAVQKHLRRGEIAQTAAAASALADLPGGRSSLARRLPVITAEDVGARWLPAVWRTVQTTSGKDSPPSKETLVSIAVSLASLPKDREAYWLAATCWDGRRTPAEVSRDALRQALADKNHQDGVAVCLAARLSRRWRSADRLIDVIRSSLDEAPSLAREVGRAALEREALGGIGTAELLAAAIMAVIDRPNAAVPDLPHVSVDPIPGSYHPSWYTQDGHTALGRRVLARVAREVGHDFAQLSLLMFDYESTVVGPSGLSARWMEEALSLDARAGGWHTAAAGARAWSAIRIALG